MENTQTLNMPASVEEARQKILALKEAVNSMAVGRDAEVEGILSALLSKNHVVMIGPPGTAKSFIALTIASMLSARVYRYMLTKYTTHEELIGYIDVAEFVRTGQLRRRWSSIAEADIAFLDEMFNADGAILNTLLSLMQERVIYDPLTGSAVQTPLWTLIGASNRAPEEEELAAIYDRFAVKLFVQPIGSKTDKLLAAIERKWRSGKAEEVKVDMESIKVLHDYVLTLAGDEEVHHLYKVYVVPFLQMVMTRLYVSDRSAIDSFMRLFAAELVLKGRVDEAAAAEAAYKIINYAARTPEELAEVQKAVEEVLGEVAELRNKMRQAQALLENLEFNKALELLREVATVDLKKFENRPWLLQMAKSIVSDAQELVIKIQSELAKFKIR
jgi:MoxR-like ATPase